MVKIKYLSYLRFYCFFWFWPLNICLYMTLLYDPLKEEGRTSKNRERYRETMEPDSQEKILVDKTAQK